MNSRTANSPLTNTQILLDLRRPSSPSPFSQWEKGKMKCAARKFGGCLANSIDVIKLTRELIDIPSVTGEEFQIGTSVGDLLVRLGYHVEAQDIADERSNIIATTEAAPRIVLSTHMDTVPPFIESSEDDEFIYGRGACDAKGIIA